jgi:hypothetical protein
MPVARPDHIARRTSRSACLRLGSPRRKALCSTPRPCRSAHPPTLRSTMRPPSPTTTISAPPRSPTTPCSPPTSHLPTSPPRCRFPTRTSRATPAPSAPRVELCPLSNPHRHHARRFHRHHGPDGPQSSRANTVRKPSVYSTTDPDPSSVKPREGSQTEFHRLQSGATSPRPTTFHGANAPPAFPPS